MAMYTKMTATGSSLIVNPRTISKELETKIAASIASVMATHDVAKLSTKLVRQAVEKDVHVSLANHKEVLKRLMHQELRKIKAKKAAKRVVPEPWKIAARRESIVKALARVYELSRHTDTTALHAIQALYDLQAVESGPVLRLSALYARLLGARWLREDRHADWVVGSVPTSTQLVEAIYSVYVVERLGICHPRRAELLDLLGRSPPHFQPQDLLGWNPAVSAPPPSDGSSSLYERFTDALLLWYYTNYLGQTTGYTLIQLLQYLPMLYPYKSPTELSVAEYGHQLNLVVSLVMVLTNFGRLRCEPELLPHEYFFLRQHLVFHISQQDAAIVGESLRALKCFEGSDNLVPVRRAMAFLLVTQDADGSWKTGPFANDDLTRQYYSTMSALRALSEPRKLGFAPAFPDITPLLELHLNADIGLPPLEITDAPKTKTKTAGDGQQAATVSSSRDAQVGSAAELGGDLAFKTTDAEPPNADDLEGQVRFQQGLLENEGNIKHVPAKLATHVLSTLSGMQLTVDILKSTGIGRTINKLRKHAAPEVAKAAGQLVAKWKKDLL